MQDRAAGQRNAAHYEDNLNLLLWVFGLAIVISLVVLMLFFSRQDWATSAVSFIGVVAGGAGIKWVVDRQADAITEEKNAYNDLVTACGNTEAADSLRVKMKLSV